MFAKSVMPKFLKEVMTHIPTVAMKSVDWRGIVKELGPMASRLGKKDLDDKAFKSLASVESDVEGLTLSRIDRPHNFKNLGPLHKKEAGERILEFYFSQLKNEDGLALDLRPKHFYVQEDELLFRPNNFWYRFDNDFRQSLIDLYKGFYFDQEELYNSALERIGLTKNLDADKTATLKDLFKSHFGPGEQKEMEFKLEKFKDSFYELFKFFVDNKVELSKDFIFLGAYLVGLYTSLEELGASLDARKAFNRSFPKEA